MILVTGGAGFIGSNFVLDWWAQSQEAVVNLDKLTYAGKATSLAALAGNPQSSFVHGDIADSSATQLSYIGHTLSDNRHSLIASAEVTVAYGHAKLEAAKLMVGDVQRAADVNAQITLGADKGYDLAEFIETLTDMKVAPDVAQNTSFRKSAAPSSVVSTADYTISQQKSKLIEQVFGWAKRIGLIREVMVRGLKSVDQLFVLTMAAYNLTCIPSLGQNPSAMVALRPGR